MGQHPVIQPQHQNPIRIYLPMQTLQEDGSIQITNQIMDITQLDFSSPEVGKTLQNAIFNTSNPDKIQEGISVLQQL